jgi:hypothetical protein
VAYPTYPTHSKAQSLSYYSLERDFDDVYDEAAVELAKLGFRERAKDSQVSPDKRSCSFADTEFDLWFHFRRSVPIHETYIATGVLVYDLKVDIYETDNGTQVAVWKTVYPLDVWLRYTVWPIAAELGEALVGFGEALDESMQNAAMKMGPLKLLLVAGFGGVALATVAAIGLGERPPMRFRFLDGRELLWRTSGETERREYRIARDYGDVYADARAELTALGFEEEQLAERAEGYGLERGSIFALEKTTHGVRILVGERYGEAYVRVIVLWHRMGFLKRLRYTLLRVRLRYILRRNRS